MLNMETFFWYTSLATFHRVLDKLFVSLCVAINQHSTQRPAFTQMPLSTLYLTPTHTQIPIHTHSLWNA